MKISRRNFLNLVGMGATGAILASSLKNLYANAQSHQSLNVKGFGDLVKDPQGIMDLPKGFQYRVLSRSGETMGDGGLVPGLPDGMAAFAGDYNTTILIRNHELNPPNLPSVSAPLETKYDPGATGGTTTLIIDSDRHVIREYVSLSGTMRNCAGGITPWDTWISCEETILTPSQNGGFGISRKHGYNFEVSPKGANVEPIPLVAMGRFNHEAIAVDPATGIVYQTEDRNDGCIYRFVPNEYGNLQAGGKLDALMIANNPQVDTSKNFPVNRPVAVQWVRLEDIDPESDTLRYEAYGKGAAVFKRGEGMWYGNDAIYWSCTSGGNAGKGQIFRYNPADSTVELFLDIPPSNVLEYPDNITVAPFGDVMVCEDGAGDQYITGITPEGKIYKFARNALNNYELAGICFSPDGKTMFVNIHIPGITLAIWGF
jgi:uncharacterized protein